MAQRGNNEGSVYFDASKDRWRAAVTIDGRRRRASALTEAGAKKKLRELLAEADAKGSLGDGNATVGQLLAQWRRTALPARDLSPRTVDVYDWATRVLDNELGTRRLRALAPEDVERVLTQLATEGTLRAPEYRTRTGEPLGRSSLIKIRSVLGKALDFAERRGVVNRNVARVVELPADARRPVDGRALTLAQARTLIDSIADHRLEALWTTMLMLGLRPGEATGLTWSDVDLTGAVVHVRRSLKLERGHLVLSDRLKTSRSRRSLDAPEQVVTALRRHRGRQAAERLEVGPLWSNPEDLVFTTTLGSAIDPNNLRRTFARVTTAAGLGTWHPHELRHSAASIMSAAGLPLEHIADVLGHDGTRMTALVYRHAVTPTIDGAARVMGSALA
jgi:integrase